MQRQHLLCLVLGTGLASCSSPATGDGFAAGGGISHDVTTSAATSSSSTSSSSTSSGSTSSGSTSSGSASSGSASSTSSTGDVDGSTVDFGPVGCAGKIDLLFVLSNQDTMEPSQHLMQSELPHLLDGIHDRFADFDTQILVTDADGIWGMPLCKFCKEACAVGPPEYPCLSWSELEECDSITGAGVTFPAGWGTQNKRCPLPGDRRYMLATDPNLEETFECLTSVGYSGGVNAPVTVLLLALSKELSGPSGCNAGFLRDDALLVVVVIADTYEPSKGTPAEWKEALLQAKGGNPDAVFLLAITTDIDLEEHLCLWWEDTDPEKNPMRALVELMMPHALIRSICAPSWRPFFDEAADLVLEQCELFVPQ